MIGLFAVTVFDIAVDKTAQNPSLPIDTLIIMVGTACGLATLALALVWVLADPALTGSSETVALVTTKPGSVVALHHIAAGPVNWLVDKANRVWAAVIMVV